MTYARLFRPLLLLCALILITSSDVLAQQNAMKIEARHERGVTILEPKGKITLGVGDIALRNAVKEALEAGARNILVDLNAGGLIDAAVVAALIRIGTEARQGGAAFKLLLVADKVQPALEDIRLIEVFETYDDEIDAIGSFANRAKSKRIYVGNLPFSASDDEVREMFAEYGAVNSVSLVTDLTTGESAGFGFVQMEQAADAVEAISALHQSQMGGRSLNVNEARPRTERPSGQGPRQHGW